MGREHLGRRELLTAAGVGVVAAAGMGGVAAAAPSGAREDDSRITGGWLIVRKDDGDPTPIQAVVSFAAGGAFLALDIKPPAPPLVGSWAGHGENGFTATFYGSADDGQGTFGTVRVHATGRVDGDRITGTYRVHVNVGGHTFDGTGSFHGTRIEA